MYEETFYTWHKQRFCDIKVDENGTFKAEEHDKYENIAGSDWLSLFMGSIFLPAPSSPGLSATQYLHQYTVQYDPS
jgi:hypothetical protein